MTTPYRPSNSSPFFAFQLEGFDDDRATHRSGVLKAFMPSHNIALSIMSIHQQQALITDRDCTEPYKRNCFNLLIRVRKRGKQGCRVTGRKTSKT